MKYCGTLISVSDMTRARNFYEQVMEQKVMLDLGVHVSFENAFSLQSNYEELVGVKLEAQQKPNNFQLYFEVDDLERWEAKLKSTEGIEFIHEIKEYPWGQRVFRFYDYDKFIVEVAESMKSVAMRYLAQGLSVEETAKCTMLPIEVVKQFQSSFIIGSQHTKQCAGTNHRKPSGSSVWLSVICFIPYLDVFSKSINSRMSVISNASAILDKCSKFMTVRAPRTISLMVDSRIPDTSASFFCVILRSSNISFTLSFT